MPLRLLLTTVLLMCLAAPASAMADTVVVADRSAAAVTALDRTLVWVSEPAVGHTRLMQRSPNGVVARVKGTPDAGVYNDIDLGRDERGGLVLTYQRCASIVDDSSCRIVRDDLHGSRSSIRGLTLKDCTVSIAPALWGSRAAYGLKCTKDSKPDSKRSGLYVKRDGVAPRKLRVPSKVSRFARNPLSVHDVDVRATRVAAAVGDPLTFSQNADASGLMSFRAAFGRSGGEPLGLALGGGGTHWALSSDEDPYADMAGLPIHWVINKRTRTCLQRETVTVSAGRPAAEDLAVDGTTLYLIAPAMGIVTHTFNPDPTPAC